MAKIYISFSDAKLEETKISIEITLVVVGGTEPVSELRFSKIFLGQPTAAEIIADMKALALIEANVYLTEKLLNKDIVLFCAPT